MTPLVTPPRPPRWSVALTEIDFRFDGPAKSPAKPADVCLEVAHEASDGATAKRSSRPPDGDGPPRGRGRKRRAMVVGRPYSTRLPALDGAFKSTRPRDGFSQATREEVGRECGDCDTKGGGPALRAVGHTRFTSCSPAPEGALGNWMSLASSSPRPVVRDEGTPRTVDPLCAAGFLVAANGRAPSSIAGRTPDEDESSTSPPAREVCRKLPRMPGLKA
jgi:hypothetical protein